MKTPASIAIRVTEARNPPTPFKKLSPGKDWWEGVKKIHPHISIRKPEKLATSRARMLNPVVVERYMQDLGHILESLNVTYKPSQIWNCDETGKQFEHQKYCWQNNVKQN